MLEMMTVEKKGGISRWNGILPSQDSNTLFRMHTFNTSADIIDKGPNSIPVTKNGSVAVGSNNTGTYLNFPGGGSWINWTSSLLNGNSYDMTMIIDTPTYSGGQYPLPLIDSRPSQTNGQYVSFFYNQTSPFILTPYYNGSGGPVTTSVPAASFPVVLKLSIRPSSISIYAGDSLIGSWSGTFTLAANAPFKIARHAYSNVVTDGIFKMYYFDIKKVP